MSFADAPIGLSRSASLGAHAQVEAYDVIAGGVAAAVVPVWEWYQQPSVSEASFELGETPTLLFAATV